MIDRFAVFTLRELSAHRGRAIASTVVVAAATALLVAVLCILTSINGAIDSLGDRLVGTASLEVSASSGAGIPGELRDTVAAVDGVAAAVPLIQARVATANGDLLLLGTDASAGRLHSPVQNMVAEHLGALVNTPNGILAGPQSGFPQGAATPINGRAATIVAVLQGDDAEAFNGGRFLFATARTAQLLAGRGNAIDSILVVTDPGADTATVAERIRRAVDGRALVGPPAAAQAKASNGVQLIRYVAVSSAAMTFLVAGFLIYTTMSMAVAGRRARLSILRALGGTRRALVGDLLAETALYATVGAVLGAGIGILIGRYSVGSLPAVFMQTLSARVAFSVPPLVVVAAALGSIVVAVAAAAFAARAVYRVSPVEALAPVGVSRIDRTPGWQRVAAGAAAVVLAAASVFAATTQPGILANSGISVMFAALLAFSFAIGDWLVRAAAALAARWGGPGALAGETIARSPRRSWATLMVVAVAVAASLAISAGNANAVDSAERSFAPLAEADAWVSTSAPGTFATGAALPAELIDRVTQTDGVARVVREQAMFVDVGSQRALLFGLAAGSVNPLLRQVAPELGARVVAGDGVVLTTDLAESLGLRAGDDLSITTPTGRHTIAVLATVPYFSGLNGAIAIGYDRVQEWFGAPGATALQVVAQPGAGAAVVDRLEAGVPAGVHAFSGRAAVAGFRDALAQATTLNHVIWVIVTAIAVVAVFNALFLSVLDRRRELGVLRAIGASRRFTVRTVFAESLAIAVIGALCGIAFGLIQQVIADIASSRAWNVDVGFALVPASFAIAFGVLVVCTLGAVPPARKVSRLSIVDAMRIE